MPEKPLKELNKELIALNSKIDPLVKKREHVISKIRKHRIREIHSRS